MKKVARILGSGGAIPIAGKAASSEIVFINDTEFVLVDAGFGIAQAISISGESYSNLNSIFISHYHTDHFSDLPTILFSYFLSTKRDSIRIFIPKEGQDFLENLFFKTYGHLAKLIQVVNGYSPTIELVPFSEESIQLGDSLVTSFIMSHGNIETYGLTFDFNSFKLSISSDTTYCDSLIQLAMSSDVLIQDCAFSDDFGPNPLHAIPSQIVKLINEASVKKVYLNHLMPETIGKENTMVESIRKDVASEVLLANDGQDIFI